MPENTPDRQTDGKLRLNRFLAEAGLCSRRKADALILSGAVQVNGQTAESGMRIDPAKDLVSVAGKILEPAAARGARHYLMLHKPIQVVSTASDPQGRTTVLSLLPPEYGQLRLYPVGRLDYFSEGLLLLTNDGELTQRLTHPRYHVPRVYEVRLREKAGARALAAMRAGMRLAEGEKIAPVEVATADGGQNLRLTLRQGLNRQIRRMCRDLGLTILTLRRVALGPLRLGDLEKGRCRSLEPEETAALKKSVGLGP